MYNFATWLTRTYHESIGWNEDNLYSNLTRSSSGVCVLPAAADSLYLMLKVDRNLAYLLRYSHPVSIALSWVLEVLADTTVQQ